MSDFESRRIRANEARQFMADPLFRAMFDGVSAHLEDRALNCDTKHTEIAADIIRCKQLLAAMKREIERRVEDGDVAAFQLRELEKRGTVQRIFRR